ncbi:hypothetical protein [Streptomyces sp. NPDC004250]|uniref:hypothetical protein n=1 Tax=Streptomyces sp. NPDC004250 TaxID=3364692 RepID=UPI0036CE88DB
MRVRRPAAGRKDRDKFISGKSKQNAVKTMVVTDGDGRMLFCSPTQRGSGADITQVRQLGLFGSLSWLQPGDEVVAAIEGLGELRNVVTDVVPVIPVRTRGATGQEDRPRPRFTDGVAH